MRVGEPSYSIKSLERFYMPARATQVVSGGDSIVIYDRYRETGEGSLLDDLRDYNRDDCLSTLLLRDWLIDRARKRAAGRQPRIELSRRRPRRIAPRARSVRRGSVTQAALEAALVADPKAPDAEARQLMADLVGFHRREAKPAWWAFFDRQERSAEELAGRCGMPRRLRRGRRGLDRPGQEELHLPLSLSRTGDKASRGSSGPSRRNGVRAPAPFLPSMRRRGPSRSSAA